MLKITRPGFGWYVESNIGVAVDELRLTLSEGCVGDTIVFEVVEMTQEEYDALDEFRGW